jgi:hypothetical protein
LDWFALGTAVAKSMQRAPTIDFLYVEWGHRLINQLFLSPFLALDLCK